LNREDALLMIDVDVDVLAKQKKIKKEEDSIRFD
jgi:hypothetical protein